MSRGVRSTRLMIALGALALAVGACGPDNPAGTIGKGDLPGNVEVRKVRHDVQAGQVDCQAVNDAEDDHVLWVSDSSDPDRQAAVAYEFKGPHHQEVSDSVWRLSHPTEAVARVAAGLAECVKHDPAHYQRFEVDGYANAVAYTAKEGRPLARYTRRILVPLSDRVVIVTSSRQGGSEFEVMADDLLHKAIAVSKDAPKV